MDMGVTVALSGEYSNSLGAREDLIWNAAELMKVLHDEERVLTTITAAPAKILGVEDVIGTIEPGKRADICVWSANSRPTTRMRCAPSRRARSSTPREIRRHACN